MKNIFHYFLFLGLKNDKIWKEVEQKFPLLIFKNISTIFFLSSFFEWNWTQKLSSWTVKQSSKEKLYFKDAKNKRMKSDFLSFERSEKKK